MTLPSYYTTYLKFLPTDHSQSLKVKCESAMAYLVVDTKNAIETC